METAANQQHRQVYCEAVISTAPRLLPMYGRDWRLVGLGAVLAMAANISLQWLAYLPWWQRLSRQLWWQDDPLIAAGASLCAVQVHRSHPLHLLCACWRRQKA